MEGAKLTYDRLRLSYFTASLTPYALSSAEASLFVSQGGCWEKENESTRAGHKSCLTSLGLRFIGQVDSATYIHD